jgi:hypothetical protein
MKSMVLNAKTIDLDITRTILQTFREAFMS